MYDDFEPMPKKSFAPRWKWEQVPRQPTHQWDYYYYFREQRRRPHWGWWPFAAEEYTLRMNGHLMMHVDRAERKRLTAFSRWRFTLLTQLRSEIRDSITDYIYISLEIADES